MNARDGAPAWAIEQHHFRTALTVAQLNIVLLRKRLVRHDAFDREETLEILRRVECAHKTLIDLLREPKHSAF